MSKGIFKKVMDYYLCVHGTVSGKILDAVALVVTSEDDIRIYFNGMSYVLLFSSNFDLDDISKLLDRVFNEDNSAYVLSMSDKTRVKFLGAAGEYMNLKRTDVPLTVNTVREFLNAMDELKNRLSEMADNHDGIAVINLDTEIQHDEPNESERMDAILDKINKTGMSSLNKEECDFLTKMSTRNGKKK